LCAEKAGLKDLLVVQTDGTKIIAVQRTDLDMRTDKRARELAIADNRVAELDLDWTRIEEKRRRDSLSGIMFDAGCRARYSSPRFSSIPWRHLAC
jgi:hypothetical protein